MRLQDLPVGTWVVFANDKNFRGEYVLKGLILKTKGGKAFHVHNLAGPDTWIPGELLPLDLNGSYRSDFIILAKVIKNYKGKMTGGSLCG